MLSTFPRSHCLYRKAPKRPRERFRRSPARGAVASIGHTLTHVDADITDYLVAIRATEERARPPTEGDLGDPTIVRTSWRNPRAREEAMVTNPFEVHCISQPPQQVQQQVDRRSC